VMDAQEAKKNTAGGIVAVLFNAKGVKLSVQDVAFAAKIIKDYAAAHSAQVEAERDEAKERLDVAEGLLLNARADLAEREAELVKLREALRQAFELLAALNIAVEWELAPPIKRRIAEIVKLSGEALGETGPQ
jgi:hypothetical protein